VPLNAFPALNTILPEQIPSSIDFGKYCKIGKEYIKSLSLASNSFVDFDYTLKFVTPHPDFKILASQSGILKSNTVTELNFSFSPSITATAEAFIELATSEFGIIVKTY